MNASSYGKLITEDFSTYQLSSYPDALHWYTTDGYVINTSNSPEEWGSPNAAFGGNPACTGSGGSASAPAPAQNDTDMGFGLATSLALDPESPIPSSGQFSINFRHAVTVVTCTFINARNITITLFRENQSVRTYNVADHGINSKWEAGFNSFCVNTGFENIDRILIDFSEASVLTEFTYYHEVRGTSHAADIEVVDKHNYIADSEDFELGPANNIRTQFEHFSISGAYGFDSANPGANTAFGSPSNDFAGPGVGSGGLADKPGQNDTALGTIIVFGGPTPQTGVFNIIFRELVYINSITFLNCDDSTNQVELKDENNAVINTRLIGDYGPNSKVKMIWGGRYRVKTITITANIQPIAIAEIEYDRREEFTQYQIAYLPDNANTRFSITKIGNSGAGSLYITPAFGAGSAGHGLLNKGDPALNSAFVPFLVNASPTGEGLRLEWLSNSSPALYHNSFKTGGTGELLEYVCKIIFN